MKEQICVEIADGAGRELDRLFVFGVKEPHEVGAPTMISVVSRPRHLELTSSP